MVSYDAGVEVNGLLESPQPWIGPPTTLVDCSPRGLSALTHSPLASRFFCWQGLSGKGYIFSVYAASDCPAFCDAILLAVARDKRGVRRILTVMDTGAFPEPVLVCAEREFGASADTLEFHVHMLARSVAERRSVLGDLKAAFQLCLRPDGR